MQISFFQIDSLLLNQSRGEPPSLFRPSRSSYTLPDKTAAVKTSCLSAGLLSHPSNPVSTALRSQGVNRLKTSPYTLTAKSLSPI